MFLSFWESLLTVAQAIIDTPAGKQVVGGDSKRPTPSRSYEVLPSFLSPHDQLKHEKGTLDESGSIKLSSEPNSPFIPKEARNLMENVDQVTTIPLPNEGVVMPFDMDTGALTNPAAGLESISMGAANQMETAGGNSEVALEGGPKIARMIDSRRVPCPRLCGASFGHGTAGLVCFHNGEVKKTWSWYQSTEAKRPTGPSSSSETQIPEGLTRCPRTVSDLLNMTKAAKDAQWGQEPSGHQRENSDSSLDERYSDSSDDSVDSEIIVAEAGSGLYDKYFGDKYWSLAGPQSYADNVKVEGELETNVFSNDDAFDGPTTDMIAPEVTVVDRDPSVLFNGQSPHLGEEMKLGDWDIDLAFAEAEDDQNIFRTKRPAIGGNIGHGEPTFLCFDKSERESDS